MFYDSIVIISKFEYLDFISFARGELQRQLFQSSVNDQTIAITETVQHECTINRQRNLESFQYNAPVFLPWVFAKFPIPVCPFWLPFHTLHYIWRRIKKRESSFTVRLSISLSHLAAIKLLPFYLIRESTTDSFFCDCRRSFRESKDRSIRKHKSR